MLRTLKTRKATVLQKGAVEESVNWLEMLPKTVNDVDDVATDGA